MNQPALEQGVDPRVADFWIRGLARIIDYGLGFVVGIVATFVAAVAVALSGKTGDPNEWLAAIDQTAPAAFAASILGSTLYSAASEFIGGASLGKWICGLRVMSQEFGRVTLLGALVRSFAVLVDGLFFGAVAYAAMQASPLRQRLGDRWGGTVVVRVQAAPESRRGFPRTSFGILFGFAIFVATCAYWLAGEMAGAGQVV